MTKISKLKKHNRNTIELQKGYKKLSNSSKMNNRNNNKTKFNLIKTRAKDNFNSSMGLIFLVMIKLDNKKLGKCSKGYKIH